MAKEFTVSCREVVLSHSVDEENSLGVYSGHAIALVGQYVYVFGGTDFVRGKVATNNVFRFNITSKSWETMRTPGAPANRQHHRMLLVDDTLYIYGGFDRIGTMWTDMYVYDLVKQEFREIEQLGTALDDHTNRRQGACLEFLDWIDSLLLLGGRLDLLRVAEFDIQSRTWTDVHTKGNLPRPRQYAMTAVTGQRLFLYGGVPSTSAFLSDMHVLDMEVRYGWYWTMIIPNKPGFGRANGTLMLYCGMLIVYGGRDDSYKVATDITHCDLKFIKGMSYSDPRKERQLAVDMRVEFPRRSHLQAVKLSTSNEYLILGGLDVLPQPSTSGNHAAFLEKCYVVRIQEATPELVESSES